MSANGCGRYGTLSRVWRGMTGTLPPFEGCCNEHDLAYEQAETEADRRWADDHFRRCVVARGYRVTGVVLWLLVRVFGGLPSHTQPRRTA
ncbi:hypothetical protein [Nitratidesulfovibrio vulgaris]|uniref:hypothetical protein n=1 Tax=Nitratidesulfovibrio vulgaris TaxID=881 RepID=UPI0013E06285|nr:hypothetical protein [Nitratidesulfovibrio vulgaris]